MIMMIDTNGEIGQALLRALLRDVQEYGGGFIDQIRVGADEWASLLVHPDFLQNAQESWKGRVLGIDVICDTRIKHGRYK